MKKSADSGIGLLICIIFAFIITLFLNSCVVMEDARYGDPIYQNHVIIYDVWPNNFYNYNNTTYIYSKPINYKPRNRNLKPRKPRINKPVKKGHRK